MHRVCSRSVHCALHCALCIVIVRTNVLPPRHRRRHGRHPRDRRSTRAGASSVPRPTSTCRSRRRRPAGPSRIRATGGGDLRRRCARRSRQRRVTRRKTSGGRPLGTDARRRAARRRAARCCARRSSGATSAPRPSAATITETVGAAAPDRADVRTRRSPASRCRSCSGCASTSPRSGRASRHVLLPKDYVRYRLTGESRDRRRRRVGHAAVRRGAAAGGRATCSTRWSIDAALLPRVFESPEVTARVSTDGRGGRPASARARPSSRARAIRRPARSAWASCAPARSARPSARRASSSPPPTGPRSTRRAASTRSVTPCPGAGTSWA